MRKPAHRVEIPEQALLCSMFYLDGGNLVRKTSSGNRKAGSIAGSITACGYRRLMIDGSLVLAHRAVWKMVVGSEPPEFLDHINGDRSDNRIENLRAVSHSENMHNQESRRSNSSGFTGVRWYDYPKSGKRPCWVAYVMVNRKAKTVGYFDDIRHALLAYEVAIREVHGEFADRKIANNREVARSMGIEL